jgi:quercetin dioxygenase-like cupin family protein
MSLNISDCQKIVIPEGAIYLGPSDKIYSAGFLFLEPGKELPVHSRPVVEELCQTEGTSTIILYDKNILVDKIILEVGEKVKIPANFFHQHINSEKTTSLTFWEFNGDIAKIIDDIRNNK